MKAIKQQLIIIPFIIFLFGSCHAQKIMRKLGDAEKIQINKKEFINKPFKTLLNEIGPDIKFVYGNPDNKGEGIVGTNIKIFFVDKEEFFKRKRESKEPTGILVTFYLEPNNTRKAIPIGGVNINSKELIPLYGSMVIKNIYVTGTD